MVNIFNGNVYLFNGNEILRGIPENKKRISEILQPDMKPREGTITHGILSSHTAPAVSRREDTLSLTFDAMTSHDITFVNIIQTAKVSGLEKFPLPYILTNCHNSLCAVGGTINEDDHLFGLSAARKYGGVYVPPHLAVIHSYIRETQAGCGKMILGSDSHTRYGALGTLAVGEGGGELVKQLLGQTYDMKKPKVIGVYLSGKPQAGVGPMDVALALIQAAFTSGIAKNAVLEFVGEGVSGLSADFRCAVDVMTTETTCWSSIWRTDEVIRDYLVLHKRGEDYRKLEPAPLALYDGMLQIDLSRIKPMIALPFHPSNVFEIDALLENPGDILSQVEKDAAGLLEEGPGKPTTRFNLTDKLENGRLKVDQGIIAGCAGGTFENIMAAASLLKGKSLGNGEFSLSVYPGSQPILLELAKNGTLAELISSGAVIRTAFCGPCFGAGDVPANGSLSIRHTTRNFPNREGSKPANGQRASVALMDARSIAASAANGGFLASALTSGWTEASPAYHYDGAPYTNRVYNGIGRPRKDVGLRYGPNITDWPPMQALGEVILLKIVSFITDPVTTTDELIPSGETSSFRSNPVGLAEFTLSRKDPLYVGRAKEVRAAEEARREGRPPEEALPELKSVFAAIAGLPGNEKIPPSGIQIGSALYARKPGDGSAREQAASCQKVLGGWANFAREYATKRYRSNLINWGLIPFIVEGEPPFTHGSYIFIPRVREALTGGGAISAYIIDGGAVREASFPALRLESGEKELILSGCLINYTRARLRVHSARAKSP
ncbi:MAG: hydratase [Spirochaetales bacterium]|jgi:aconitate hydratase|nr:hydratase [Spirochaetales bacterium]